MGKHNDKAWQDKLKQTFTDRLREQFNNGLAQGVFATCKVVIDRANDESKTFEERLESIKTFCSPLIGREGNTAEKAGD